MYKALAGADPNPHATNEGIPWLHAFAPRITAALVKAMNLGSQRLSASLSKTLVTYLGIVEERLTNEVHQAAQLYTDISKSHNASRMRLDVLWWTEVLYSPLLSHSYREMK